MLSLIRRPSLAQWLLIAVAAGVVCGLVAPEFARQLAPVSDIFLRLIRAIVAPLLFAVLVRAIAGVGDMRQLGRFGFKALVCFEIATTLALIGGWCAGVFVQPGVGVALTAKVATVAQPMTLSAVLVNAFPASLVDALARGDVLQVVVFSFIFGVAALSLGEKARPFLAVVDSFAELAFRFTHYVMWLAPAAVFAALAGTLAANRAGTLAGLVRFVATVWVVELLFLLIVIGGGLALARVPFRRFVARVREPFAVAFATTSSAAALPQTLENLERLGVPRPILGVVAPLSVSLNLNGSTIYLGLATVFIAQAAGVHLTVTQQLAALIALKLASKGVAGIPRANLIVLAGVFPTLGLPPEGLALLLGIDAFTDPIRTSVNVVSHAAAPAIVARWEGARLDADPAPDAKDPK
jgi:proton glutamate symport protein